MDKGRAWAQDEQRAGNGAMVIFNSESIKRA